jgi:hypothetical protein
MTPKSKSTPSTTINRPIPFTPLNEFSAIAYASVVVGSRKKPSSGQTQVPYARLR